MNNISKLIKSKIISFNEVFIQNYSKLNLCETDAMIIIMLQKEIEQGICKLDSRKIVKCMCINEEEFDKRVIKLVELGFIEIIFDTDFTEKFSLDLTYDKLENFINGNNSSIISNDEKITKIINYIEGIYERIIKPNELEIIKSWVEIGYSGSEIEYGIIESINQKKKSLKYADAIIANNKNEKEEIKVSEEVKNFINNIYVKH